MEIRSFLEAGPAAIDSLTSSRALSSLDRYVLASVIWPRAAS